MNQPRIGLIADLMEEVDDIELSLNSERKAIRQIKEILQKLLVGLLRNEI